MIGRWILAAILFAAMTAALIYGFTAGNGWSEVRELTAYPWFNVSLVDVYVGFILFSVWVVQRERNRFIAALWIVAIMTLGNWTACIYVFVALARSGGDTEQFWLGRPSSHAVTV